MNYQDFVSYLTGGSLAAVLLALFIPALRTYLSSFDKHGIGRLRRWAKRVDNTYNEKKLFALPKPPLYEGSLEGESLIQGAIHTYERATRPSVKIEMELRSILGSDED